LWQTALIRLSRLKIQDEIETGLRYYPAAFFEVIRKSCRVRTALQARWPEAQLLDEPIPAPRLVDRRRPRRNPNVTAEVVRLATGSAAYTALELLRRTPRWKRNCRCPRGW